MGANKVFEKFANYIVEESSFDDVSAVMKLTLQNPEDDSTNEILFKNVTYYSFMLDAATHRVQEENDLPRAFVEVSEEAENLGVTKHKNDWFKAFEFNYNVRVVFSDAMILMRMGLIEVDGIDVEAYPEDVSEEEDAAKDNSFFYSDEELDEMEHNGQWEESVKYLKQKWEAAPYQKNVLYRYAAQNWYAFTHKEETGMDGKDQKNMLKTNLKEALNYAKEHCWEESDCLWLFGYMMQTGPFAFVAVITYLEDTKNEGRELVNTAAGMIPENILAQVTQLADEKRGAFKKKKKQLAPNLEDYFPTQSALDRYFREYFTL